MNYLIRRMALLALAIFPSLVFSACRLPTPDMGGEEISPPNYTGYLKKKKNGEIYVKDYGGDKIQYIDVSHLDEAYSAYGGDEKFENLKYGIAVRVWFKNCLPHRRPSADYVEYFSNNPLDQPSSSYFLRR